MLEESGDLTKLKLIDFGIAKRAYHSAELREHTGTRAYMSPQMLKSPEEPYTSKCDIWAVGAMAYQLLTNSYLFDEDLTTEDREAAAIKGMSIGKLEMQKL